MRYSERYMDTARRCPDESERSLCKYFIRGLLPHLTSACCLDDRNREWQCLPDLIDYSIKQEDRMTAARSAREVRQTLTMLQSTAKAKPNFDRSRSRPSQNHAQAHAAMEVEGQGTAAPVIETKPMTGILSEEDNPYVDRKSKPRTWEQVARYNRDNGPLLNQIPVRIAELRPVEECPAFDVRGLLKAQPRAKALLAMWFVCPLCRRDRHDPSACPRKFKEAGHGGKKRPNEGEQPSSSKK